MRLSKDAALVQDTLSDCLNKLKAIQHQAPFLSSQALMDNPIRSLTGVIFDLDKTIGVLARLERQDG